MKIRGSGFFGIPSFDVISVITGVTHGGIMPHRLYDYCVLPISSFESLMVLQNYILPEEIVKAEASVEVKTPLREGSFRKKAAEPL